MAQVDAIVALVRRVLGDDALGAYLHGSAVLGTLRPHSDTDVLVVSRRPVTAEERRALVDGILDLSGRRARLGADRPVELTIVVQDDVRPWRYPPACEFLYGEWLRDGYEHGDLPGRSAEAPDLAPLITMVLMGDRPLFGPPPGEVLDPVPPHDLVRAVVAGVPGLLDDLEPDTANVVLTLARVWTTVATGTILAKDAAADWVLARLPDEHRAVLARARGVYLGEAEDRWDDLAPRVRPHADFVVREIERAATTRPRPARPTP